MSPVETHVAYWCRRYPSARPHREDITQEALLAAWLALQDYDEARGAMGAHLWQRMRVAVRRYLADAGVIRPSWAYRLEAVHVVGLDEAPQQATSDGPDGPLALREAWGCLVDGFSSRGFTTRQAEAMALVECGATFVEAGAAVGATKQAVEQWAKRAGVKSPFAWAREAV